jgi:hypothetical protein
VCVCARACGCVCVNTTVRVCDSVGATVHVCEIKSHGPYLTAEVLSLLQPSR